MGGTGPLFPLSLVAKQRPPSDEGEEPAGRAAGIRQPYGGTLLLSSDRQLRNRRSI